jgi:fructuronate reductase
MADRELAGFVEQLMREEVAPTLGRRGGVSADVYIDQVLDRFRNPAIAYQLSQIAWDGSQKLPVRLLATIEDALSAGRPIGRLVVGVAAWMVFVVRQARRGVPIVDPLAPRLAALGHIATGEAASDVALFLGLDDVFAPRLASRPAFRAALVSAYGPLISPPGANEP